MVIRPAPLFDARMFRQLVSTSPPRGETIPRPVTTTRRIIQSPQTGTGPAPFGLSLSKPLLSGPFTERREPFDRLRANGARSPSGLVGVDISDRVVDGSDLLGRVVRDLDPELLLEGHDELDDVQAVGAEIVDEAGVLGDLVGLDAQMLDDDTLHTVGGLAHILPFPRGYCLTPALAARRRG